MNTANRPWLECVELHPVAFFTPSFPAIFAKAGRKWESTSIMKISGFPLARE